MLATVATFGLEGVDAREVTVEVDVRRGLPAFTIVGLPDAAVREARERVRAALLNSALDFPLSRLTANLAPAWVRKAGPSFDLALAVCVLAASSQIPPARLEGTAVCGELSLSGAVRPVRGALAVASAARRAGYARLIVPVENAPEAALAEGLEVLGLSSIEDIVDVLHERRAVEAARASKAPEPARAAPDLADVRGQADAKRAIEIAAAGGHNLLMVGPPGAGKTMIARRMPGILPPPSFEEALEITRIASVAGLGGGLARERPFRGPHHTISAQGLVGGGSRPRPGEITLAHRGVLFLDELAEFSRAALEALRQPLEDGFVEITRGQRALVFPARAMLLAACNPCPCGRGSVECECAATERARYHRRLSGPLLDRIDLVCQVSPPPAVELVERDRVGERSNVVRQRVIAARERQLHRLGGSTALCNGGMDGRTTRRHATLRGPAVQRLLDVVEAGSLTGRGHDRALRLARTIADLAGRQGIVTDDLDEALSYRLAAVGGDGRVTVSTAGAGLAQMIDACDGCLRRGYLVGRLAAPIARLLDHPGRRESGLLALADHELVAAVAGDQVEDALRFLEAFDPPAARHDLQERSLGALCSHAAGYPAPLLRLGDPPAVLFVAGSSTPLTRLGAEPAVAVVGTRNPSAYGLEMAYELGRGLGAAGVSVVSGLALGIDAAAHRGCLDARGTGVAVLAGGADVPYPRTNATLYRRMLAGGAVVSELPPGQRAYRWAFPARNRIMAGLASMVVVVEAAEPSGSLITSTFAEQLGRTVAAVPGRATSRFSAGSNRLLKDGALMVTSPRDLLDELYGVGIEARGPPQDEIADGGVDRDGSAVLDAVERRALDAIEAGLGIDGLCAHAGLPAREARALLSRLESSGHLRRDGLGGYCRTAAMRR